MIFTEDTLDTRPGIEAEFKKDGGAPVLAIALITGIIIAAGVYLFF